MSVALSPEKSASVSPYVEPGGRDLIAAGALALLAFLGACLWFSFDHAYPGIDESGHILNSFQYADLLRRPRFWSGEWLGSFLTVNQFYPPAIHVFNGALKLALGPDLWVDRLSLAFFAALLSAATFAVARLSGVARAGAAFAACVIFAYPQIDALANDPLLDFPLVTMVSLSLFTMLWWRRKNSWTRAIIAGVALGAACMSKQIAGAFLALPGLFLFVEAVVKGVREKRPGPCAQVLAIALVGAAICLPWTVTNAASIRSLAQYNEAAIGKRGLAESFAGNFLFYLQSLPHIMSPLLLSVFALAAVSAVARRKGALLPAVLSSFGGLALISVLTWAFPLERYAAPALIGLAVVSGHLAESVIRQRRIWLKALAAVAAAAAAAQFISFNYSPYPLGSSWLAGLSLSMGVFLKEFRGETIEKHNPHARQDWHQREALALIDRFEHGNPCWLNILPCTRRLNVHTFEWLARLDRRAVRPTTSRVWSVMGDELSFSPQSALWYHWYLLKTGRQGNIFKTPASQSAYEELERFVRASGRFRLVKTWNAPDGSLIELYRQR